jgi:hypothetical protein
LVESHTTRPDPSQDDVDHAFGIQCDVFLLPLRLGVVLVVEQYFVHRPAMDDQQAAWRSQLTMASDIRRQLL